MILVFGQRYGYFPNPNKFVLIVKNESMRERANELFGNCGIQISSRGKRHLGAIVGTQEYKEEYIREKVGEWKEDVKALASIAKKEPQGAYSLIGDRVTLGQCLLQINTVNIT